MGVWLGRAQHTIPQLCSLKRGACSGWLSPDAKHGSSDRPRERGEGLRPASRFSRNLSASQSRPPLPRGGEGVTKQTFPAPMAFPSQPYLGGHGPQGRFRPSAHPNPPGGWRKGPEASGWAIAWPPAGRSPHTEVRGQMGLKRAMMPRQPPTASLGGCAWAATDHSRLRKPFSPQEWAPRLATPPMRGPGAPLWGGWGPTMVSHGIHGM